MSEPKTVAADLYEADFYGWTQDQAERLRRGDRALDRTHLAEEVADLGRSELNKVRSHLAQCLAHMLKHAWSASNDPRRRWFAEMVTHQIEARRAFSPGMRQWLDLRELWPDALTIANASLADFGEPPLPDGIRCPFALDDLLAVDFAPDAAVARMDKAIAETRAK